MGEGCEGGEEKAGECSSEGGVGAGAWWCGSEVVTCAYAVWGPLDLHVVGEGDEEWGVERTGVV